MTVFTPAHSTLIPLSASFAHVSLIPNPTPPYSPHHTYSAVHHSLPYPKPRPLSLSPIGDPGSVRLFVGRFSGSATSLHGKARKITSGGQLRLWPGLLTDIPGNLPRVDHTIHRISWHISPPQPPIPNLQHSHVVNETILIVTLI